MRQAFTLLLLLHCTFSFCQDPGIYVSDANNFNIGPWQILKFDVDGQNPSVFIDENLNWPQDILFFEDSNIVLISNLGSNSIDKFNATTGEYISEFASGISGPTRMKIGSDSLLYVLQWGGNGKVKRYEMDGSFVDDFTSVGVAQSIGIDWDNDGNLYVSSYTGDIVRKFDSEGMDQGIFVNTELTGPTNIWFDENGDLLVIDYDGTAVKRFDPEGNYVDDFISGLYHAEGVAFFSNGDILIGNGASSSLKLFDSEGNYIEDLVAAASGNLATPNAIVIIEEEANGISDRKKLGKTLVRPNIGNRFYIDQTQSEAIKSVKVLDLSGHCIEVLNGFEWAAENFSEGIYIIQIEFLDSRIISEKVLLKK
jgi:sugar lactone lactonase YvrE